MLLDSDLAFFFFLLTTNICGLGPFQLRELLGQQSTRNASEMGLGQDAVYVKAKVARGLWNWAESMVCRWRQVGTNNMPHVAAVWPSKDNKRQETSSD